MKPEAELLFHELADLNPTQREQYFAEHQVSPEVRSEVEALLSFDSNNEHVLTESVMAAAEQSVNAMREGSRCGAYRLMRLLGRGGMGSVYLAERADGELHHSVAIKLLRFGADFRGDLVFGEVLFPLSRIQVHQFMEKKFGFTFHKNSELEGWRNALYAKVAPHKYFDSTPFVTSRALTCSSCP